MLLPFPRILNFLQTILGFHPLDNNRFIVILILIVSGKVSKELIGFKFLIVIIERLGSANVDVFVAYFFQL